MASHSKNTGILLRAGRISSNLTQQRLGRLLDIHPQYISNWERGQCRPPEEQLLKALDILRINKQDYLSALVNDFIEEQSKSLKIAKVKRVQSLKSTPSLKIQKVA